MPRFSSLPSLLLLLSLSLALLTSGCTGDARMSRLAGTWQLNLKASQSIVDNLLDGQMPEDASFMYKMRMGAAKAVVKSQINKAIEATGGDSTYSMTLNFKADGTWSSQTNFPMAKGEKTGIWKVISDSENEMVISCVWTDSKTGKSDSTRTTIRFVKPEQIKLAPPNMNGLDLELTFDRQSAK